jgi:hypothetical protein
MQEMKVERNPLLAVYHIDISLVKSYTVGMRKKQANATTIRLEAEDREAIARIRELYGCPSESAAITLAVRMVARGELPQREPPTPSPK